MRHSLKFKYTNITLEEVRIMEKEKLSGFITRLYITIKSFAHGTKNSCFPTYRTIAEAMGLETKSFKQVIYKALKKLTEVGLIIKNHYREEKRFVITEKGKQNDLPQGKQDKPPKRKQKKKSKSLLFSNEVEYEPNVYNFERCLIGGIKPEEVQHWGAAKVRQLASEWEQDLSEAVREMLSGCYDGKEINEIVEETVHRIITPPPTIKTKRKRK